MQVHFFWQDLSSHVVIVRGKNHKKPLSVELEIWISYLFFSPWVFNHFNILCGNFNIANFEYILTFRDKPSNFDSLLMKVYSKLIWWLMRLADDWLGKELISSSRFSHWAIILICCNFFQIFFFFILYTGKSYGCSMYNFRSLLYNTYHGRPYSWLLLDNLSKAGFLFPAPSSSFLGTPGLWKR